MKFSGKKAIVTGANQSMGQKIAIELAKHGIELVISYHSDKDGAMQTISTIEKLKGKALALQADFSKNKNILDFYTQAIQKLGHIDYLVNNAAIPDRQEFLATNPDDLARVLQINTIAPYYLTQLVAQNMQSNNIKGSIVNISSIAGIQGRCFMARGSAYATSKAAINKITENTAIELSPFGIRVNAVSPGVIASGMNANTATSNPKLWQERMEKIPLKRAGTPTDISNTVLFLLSDQSEWITGQIYTVDGGHYIN